MPSTQQDLARAQQLKNAGQVPQAEALCLQIVKKEPRNAEAWNLLGIIAFQSGKPDAALDYLRRATRAAPTGSAYRSNFGAILQALGRNLEAEKEFREAVRLNPNHAEAHYNLGHALERVGLIDDAVASYQRALQLKPNIAEAHNNLGNVQRNRGRRSEAATHYRRAAELRPELAEVHNNLGSVLRDLGQPEQALAACQRAVQLRPDFAEAHFGMGAALHDLRRVPEAAACFREAVRLQPGFADAHYHLANMLRVQEQYADAEASYGRALAITPADVRVLTNLGALLVDLGRFEEAVSTYRRALELSPAEALIHFNLANGLRDLGQMAESIAAYERALELKPDFLEAHNNLGAILRALGRLAESEAASRRALAVNPADADLHNNLGNVLKDQGRFDEAESSYRRALELAPEHAEFHKALAMLLLLRGDLTRGWTEYEWRLRAKDFKPAVFPKPPWDGSPLAGRTILLHPEQGMGDTLQFIRYASLVKAQGALVLYGARGPESKLVRTVAGVDRVISEGSAAPPFDVHLQLLSLPYFLGTTLETIPSTVPYLHADPVFVETWRQRLGTVPGFRVGIVWQGNPKYVGDRQRSLLLSRFADLAAIPNVTLISLQVGAGREQLGNAGFHVVDAGGQFDTATLNDLAGVLHNLDVVIAVDTAVVHLAGALAVPVWVALPFAPDWRWLLEREDTPWYPTMRLFRQRRPGDWDEVFERIATELGCRSQHSAGAAP